MPFVWRDAYNKYIRLQRNNKKFNVKMLTKLISTQQNEISTINNYLKKSPAQILDIGCGLGIYDLALHDFYSKKFGSENIVFHLLDKTTTELEEKNVYYGYREKGAFYNNLDYTKEFLILNGIKENQINCITVDNNLALTNNNLRTNLSNIDLVISIISWGFHYPITVYLDTVYNILADDGLLCLHCRKLSENLPLLESKFDIVFPPKKSIRDGSFLIMKKKPNEIN